MKHIKIVLATVMALSLTGCDSSDYKKARKLQEEGKYEQAIEIYTSLDDYKESKDNIVYCNEMIDLVNEFEEIQTYLNDNNPKFFGLIADSDQIIKDNKPMLDETLLSKLETTLSMAKSVKKEPCELPETREELEQVLKDYGTVDYSKEWKDLQEMVDDVNYSIKQYALVDDPSEEYVISCLSNVLQINGISAVTEDHDPNGNLHKAGGYTSQIFFTVKELYPNGLDASSIIDTGTKGGGSIEVYKTREEVVKRNTYLSGFDGGIFDSGAHKIVGTVLVRASHKLTATQQNELQDAIIEQLTKVEE